MKQLSNAAAEQLVIGSIIKTPGAVDVVAEKLGPGDFHEPKAGIIYAAVARLALSGKSGGAALVEDSRHVFGKGDFVLVRVAFATRDQAAFEFDFCDDWHRTYSEQSQVGNAALGHHLDGIQAWSKFRVRLKLHFDFIVVDWRYRQDFDSVDITKHLVCVLESLSNEQNCRFFTSLDPARLHSFNNR